MRTTLSRLFALLAFVAVAEYAASGVPTAVAAATGPQLRSLGPLAFGPDGVMYAADSAAATIYALDLGTQAAGGAPGTANVADLDQTLAAMIGTDAKDIAITDLAGRRGVTFGEVVDRLRPARAPDAFRIGLTIQPARSSP